MKRRRQIGYVGIAIGALLIAIGLYQISRKQTVVIASPQAASSPMARPGDLTDTYGIVNETVYNKKTNVAFENAEQFFHESGYSSFNGLVMDRQKRLPPGLKFVDGRPLTPKDYKDAEGR